MEYLKVFFGNQFVFQHLMAFFPLTIDVFDAKFPFVNGLYFLGGFGFVSKNSENLLFSKNTCTDYANCTKTWSAIHGGEFFWDPVQKVSNKVPPLYFYISLHLSYVT